MAKKKVAPLTEHPDYDHTPFLCRRCSKPKAAAGKRGQEGTCRCGRPFKWTAKDIPVLKQRIVDYFNWCDYHIEEIPNLFYEEEFEKYAAQLKLYTVM